MKELTEEAATRPAIADGYLPEALVIAPTLGSASSGTQGVLIGRLVSKRESRHSEAPTPLAFVIGEGRQHCPQYPVTCAAWSDAAFGLLKRLDEALSRQRPQVRLPVISLRGQLELVDQGNLRVDRNVGRQDKNQGHVILWTQADVEECAKSTNEAVLGWLTDDVTQHADSEFAQDAIVQLKRLARGQQAVGVTRRQASPFQWGVNRGKTACATSASSYPDLADYVASQLEGKVVFPGLDTGLRRIAGGRLDLNQAELMTEPIATAGRQQFSLVVRVYIFSFPGRPTPIIVVEFSKRSWTRKLRETLGSATTVSGYAFPPDSTRALRFTLRKVRGEDGSWAFKLDDDFVPIERKYFAGATITAEKLLKQGHQMPECALLVALKHGTGERSETKSGVPDLDKMEAFHNISAELAKVGLVAWQGLEKVATSTRPLKDSGQAWRKHDSGNEAERGNYRDWLKEAQESICTCYSGEHHIVIAVQRMPGVEADGIEAEKCLKRILPGSVTTTRIPIPAGAHGPKAELPGKSLSPAARAAQRIKAWAPFIQSVSEQEARTGRKVDGILVIAHKWYPGGRHDDSVNMRAARVELATRLGAPVQYLLPSEELSDATSATKRSRLAGEQKFETRLMMAWLDLAYKSRGRIRPRKLVEEARKLYGETTLFNAYPDRVLALGIIRRNKRRSAANESSFLPYAIELDTESGGCTASFAYEEEDTGNMAISDPLPLHEALVKLAGLGPVQLSRKRYGEKRNALLERTQAFFKARLADFGQRGGLNPLVMVDADTCRSEWPWLTDAKIDPNNVYLAGGYNAQASWKHVRLVRIRTDNSPKVLWDGGYSGPLADTGEEVSYPALKWAEAQMFRLNDTAGTSVYLSFGSAIRHLRRGVSCYRQMPGMRSKRDAGKGMFQWSLIERHNDAWSTPTGLELFVVRSGTDQPDRVAAMVEWLRQCYPHYGGWTIKPAPLHFAHALKEYLADYELEEDEEEQEDE